MPKAIEIPVEYGVDIEEAVENRKKIWAGAGVHALFLNKIYTPEMSAQNGKAVSIEKMRKNGCFSENPDEQIKFAKKFIDAGFTHIYVHSAASDQIAFIKAYGKDVLPALKEK